MLKGFNAFQMVTGFSLFPFLLVWLSGAEFRGASLAFYAACAAYLVAFIMMTVTVFDQIDSGGK